MKPLFTSIGLVVAVSAAATVAQNTSEAGRDWTYPQADLGSTRFSSLTQINTSNVQTLKRAWTFHTGSGRFASAPMVIDGVLYFSAPNGVYAIDGVTGEQLWKFAPAPDPAAAPRGGGGGRAGRAAVDPNAADAGGRGGAAGSGGGGRFGGAGDNVGTAVRGPAYWRGANGLGPRVYSSTSAGLAAIDAKKGTPITTFGD